MTVRVAIGDRAEAQVLRIDRWWIGNRASARDLFHQEFLACLTLLESSPDIGQPQRHRTLPGLRLECGPAQEAAACVSRGRTGRPVDART